MVFRRETRTVELVPGAPEGDGHPNPENDSMLTLMGLSGDELALLKCQSASGKFRFKILNLILIFPFKFQVSI